MVSFSVEYLQSKQLLTQRQMILLALTARTLPTLLTPQYTTPPALLLALVALLATITAQV